MSAFVLAASVALTAQAGTYMPGVLAEYYSFGGVTLSAMPDLDGLEPDETLIVNSVDYGLTDFTFDGLGEGFLDNFAARYTALLNVPQNGYYTFRLESDDGSILRIDGNEVIDFSSCHSMSLVTNRIHLAAGRHDLRLDYFECAGSAGLRLSWEGPGVSGVISSENLQQDVSVDPVFYTGLYGFDVRPQTQGADSGVIVDEEQGADGASGAPAGFAYGLNAEFFRLPVRVETLAALEGMKPSLVAAVTSVVEDVDYPKTDNSRAWKGLPSDMLDDFAAYFEGYLNVTNAGVYTFRLSSDDGSDVWLDGSQFIDHGDSRHFAQSAARSISLSAGLHPLRIRYYDRDYSSGLVLEWSSGDFAMRPVSGTDLLHAVAPAADAEPEGMAQHGLDAKFYRLPGTGVETLAALEALKPALTAAVEAVVTDLNYQKTTGSWKGLPLDMTDYFAAYFEGYLYVETAGRYTFRLSSDDGSDFWLDDSCVIDHGDSRHFAQSATATLQLDAGFHPLRIRYYERDGASGLLLEWSSDSFAMRPLDSRELVRTVGTIDADGDGVPGYWEVRYGFSDSDPADAAEDTDGDGLTNLKEYRAGTDPRNSDTDADGLPDAWESAYGTGTYVADAHDDPDQDGLVNLDEYRNGTDPLDWDTDGDGLSDYEEVFNIRSNPLVADLYADDRMVIGRGLSTSDSVSATTGVWKTDDDMIYCCDRCGSITWNWYVPWEANAVGIRVMQHDPYSVCDWFDLTLQIDGVTVGRTKVYAPAGGYAMPVFFLPPALGESCHEFRLIWNNWGVNTSLGLLEYSFFEYGGEDFDGDYVPDWELTRMMKGLRLAPSAQQSLVSPVCVEGTGMWGEALDAEIWYDCSNQVVKTVKTIGDGFYVDVPLVPDETAWLCVWDSYGDQFADFVWSEFDLTRGDYAEDPLVIRVNDSLRIGCGSAGANYQLRRAYNGRWAAVTNWTASAAVPYRFEGAGTYLVSAQTSGIAGGEEFHALVEVVSSRFPARAPAVPLNKEVEIKCPGLSPKAVIEHDPGLEFAAWNAACGVNMNVLAAIDRKYGLVSRLYENGPICDVAQVTPVWFDNGSYYTVARQFPDGSQLVEVSLKLGEIPDGFSVRLEIFVAGVTFEDGSRYLTLAPEDFDANGMCTVRFIKGRGVTTSVCHRTYLIQNGTTVLNNAN